MSDQRVSELTEVTTPASGDWLYLVDVSDTSGSTNGTSRKVRIGNIAPSWNVVELGADPTGVSDSSSAFNSASTSAEVDGGTIVIPPGTYLLSSQWTVDAPGTDGHIAIWGYGAELTTSGAISALEISGSSGDPNGGVSVYGLKVNHRGNSDATYGFNCDEAWKAKFYDCTVEAHGVSATYAAFRAGNSDETDDNTGSFWCHFQNCWIRKRAGADSGDISFGILLEGAANAATIIGGAINHCTVGLMMRSQGSQNTVPNGTSIIGVDFEGNTDDITYSGTSSSTIVGPRIISCRSENSTTFFSIDGVTGTPAFAPYLAGNYTASSTTNYLSNSNSIPITSLDAMLTPDIAANGMTWKHNTTVIAEDGSGFPLTVRAVGGGRGLDVENSSGTTVAQLLWTGSGQLGRLRGNSTGQLALTAIQGISRTTTDANNLRGQVTLSSGTAAVSFGTAESDASYYIVLGGDTSGETFTWASKGTGGFTINSDNASSTAVVDWMIIR